MAVLALAIVLVLLPVTIFAVSEWRMRDVQQPVPFSAPLPEGNEALDRGRHVARTRGCFGCHGQNLEGVVFDKWPWVKRAVAPPLAEYANNHTVTELESVIRHGIDPDGRALWSMPSYNWVHMSDDDLLALIAYLRSEPTLDVELPAPSMGFGARLAVAFQGESHMADLATRVPSLNLPESDNLQLRDGEYLAKTMCIECHGFDLRGDSFPENPTPDLVILAAYSDEEFRTLMKEGRAKSGRDDLPLMSMISRDRYAYLSETELESLLAYLRTLGGVESH